MQAALASADSATLFCRFANFCESPVLRRAVKNTCDAGFFVFVKLEPLQTDSETDRKEKLRRRMKGRKKRDYSGGQAQF